MNDFIISYCHKTNYPGKDPEFELLIQSLNENLITENVLVAVILTLLTFRDFLHQSTV